MNTVKENDQKKRLVALLGADDTDSAAICRMIEEGALRTVICTNLNQLKETLAGRCMAAILDIDSVPLDNRTIRALTLDYPGTCFFCTSKDRLHPELKDAICYHLFACLHKPVDPDELHYFLKCIPDEGTESRGPPTAGA